MRKGSRKMWWVVPCSSKKQLRTESGLDIEEILKMKLATIMEEPENSDQENGILSKNQLFMPSFNKKKGKKIHLKVKMGRLLMMPQFSLKQSYVLFMTGLASKGGLHALPQF